MNSANWIGFDFFQIHRSSLINFDNPVLKAIFRNQLIDITDNFKQNEKNYDTIFRRTFGYDDTNIIRRWRLRQRSFR